MSIRLSFTLLLAFALALPLAAASPQNDAGTGADAPDDWAAAPDVAPGSYAASFGDGDGADWFRVSVPAGKGLVAHAFSPNGGLDLRIVSDDGRQTLWQNGCCQEGFQKCCSNDVGGAVRATVARVGIFNAGANGDYYLDLKVVDLFDLQITRVDIEDRPIATAAAGQLPVGTMRVVRVSVTNHGPGDAIFTGVGANVQHEWGGQRDLGGQGFDALPAGASTLVEIPWDTTGEAGDVTVHVGTGSPLELNGSNNGMQVRTYVHAGNVGTSVDVLSTSVHSCGSEGCLSSNTGWHQWGRGWWLDWNSNGRHIHSHVGTHPGMAHWQTSGHTSHVSWNLDVGSQGVWTANACVAGLPPPECVAPGGPPAIP